MLDVIQGAITVSNCHFVANDGENALGAVIDTLAGSIAIEHCHFYQNFDGTSIAQFTDAQVAFVECLFYDNATTHHEVRAAGTANVGVFNCTMSGAADDSFIFAFDANATVSATNSVFTPNPNGAVGGLGTATTTRSLFAGATGDNVDGTPTFVDAANGDYRLAPGSLGIDAADYDAYITAGGGAFDLAGNWRRVDAGAVNTGVGTFSYLDMGAYETSALAMDCNMNGVDDAADLGAKAGLTDFENGAGHAYTLNTNGAATPMVDNGSLRLTEAEILSQVASAVFDPQLPAPVEGFQVTFDFRFGPGTFEGADGISFALLDKQAHGLDALFSEFGPANDALVVRIHDFTSQTIELFYNGTLVASVPSPVDLDNQQWHHMSIVLAGGNVFVDLIPWNEAPATVISAAVPSYTPIEALYGFGARTGAVTNEQRIDNVRFTSQQSNDCDANGTPDECDEDVNGDNIPDACQCLGDLDNSGAVDVSDLLMLLAGWGTPETDVTGDGVTDVTDLLALLAGWGACS